MKFLLEFQNESEIVEYYLEKRDFPCSDNNWTSTILTSKFKKDSLFLSSQTLTVLYFNNNQIGDSGTKGLAEAIKISQVSQFSINLWNVNVRSLKISQRIINNSIIDYSRRTREEHFSTPALNNLQSSFSYSNEIWRVSICNISAWIKSKKNWKQIRSLFRSKIVLKTFRCKTSNVRRWRDSSSNVNQTFYNENSTSKWKFSKFLCLEFSIIIIDSFC